MSASTQDSLHHERAAHEGGRAADPMGTALVVSWIARIAAAAIMGQTLFFKFTGAPEAKHIFSTLGAEPIGRLGVGALELVAVVLLLVPRTVVLGAGLTVGLMVGAIGSHLFTPLGIEIKLPDQSQGDGGTLFMLGIATLIAGSTTLWLHRRQLAKMLVSLRRAGARP